MLKEFLLHIVPLTNEYKTYVISFIMQRQNKILRQWN